MLKSENKALQAKHDKLIAKTNESLPSIDTPAEKNKYIEQLLTEKEKLEKDLDDKEKSVLENNMKILELQYEVDHSSTNSYFTA